MKQDRKFTNIQIVSIAHLMATLCDLDVISYDENISVYMPLMQQFNMPAPTTSIFLKQLPSIEEENI